VSDQQADILIVDDEELICFVLANLFKVHGYSCRTASRGDEALAMIAERAPSLVVMDIRMPGLSGFDVLYRLKQIDIHIPVILMTALAGVRDAVDAMKAGAFDYVAKPFNNDDMMDVVKRALDSARKKAALDGNDEDEYDLDPVFARLGNSTVIRRLALRATRIAESSDPVLLVGDIGTGKRMMANIIHSLSKRSGPFVVLGCTGADMPMLRRELYGGVPDEQIDAGKGKIELAAAGSLLIDEIAEAPGLFQESLADVLRSGMYSKDGGANVLPCDTRMMFSVTEPAHVSVEELGISPYLLDVISDGFIHLPDLKDRKEDLPQLVTLFMAEAAKELDKSVRDISDRAMDLLVVYDWPGNVHQLKSTIRRAMLSARDMIDIPDLELPAFKRSKLRVTTNTLDNDDSPLKDRVRGHIREIERRLLLETLQKTGWNKAKASRMLQITYKTMLKKVQEYNLENPLSADMDK